MVQYRYQPIVRELCCGARRRTVEHGDFRLSTEYTTQFDRFIEGRDEKDPAASSGEGGRNTPGTQTVGVRFDDGSALSGTNLGSEQAPVGNDRPQVDLQNGA